jgi:hypothetical protein
MKLTKSFQHAITITDRIGYKHLWIDALCIIQDDNHDVDVECCKMGGIYSNAEVVVCADIAAEGSRGCFNEYSEMQSWPIRTPYGATSTFRARLWVDHWELESSMSKQQVTPLALRGWCFQERALARRVLHYGHRELIWECKEGLQCQCAQLSEHFVLDTKDGCQKRLPHGYEGKMIKSQIASYEYHQNWSLDDSQELWDGIVSEYTHRDLLLFEDRLTALCGLAKLFQQRLNSKDKRSNRPSKRQKLEDNDLGEYHAGLWSRNMQHGLTWHHATTSFRSRHRPIPNIPSWSWASVDYPVCFNPLENDLKNASVQFEFHFAKCKLRGTNAFGEVIEGELSISALLLEFQLHFNDGDWFAIPTNGGERISHLCMDVFSTFEELRSKELLTVFGVLLYKSFVLLLQRTSRWKFRRIGFILSQGGLDGYHGLGNLFSKLKAEKQQVSII